MPVFFYRAIDRSGKIVSGSLNLSSKVEVLESLKQKGFMPVSVEENLESGIGNFFANIFSKNPTLREMAAYTRQLSVLLKAGIPINDSITLLIDQTSGYLRKANIGIKEDLLAGKSLASAVEQYPSLFSNVYIQLVRAGEASGSLEVVLAKLADSIERTEKIQNKISENMRQPIFLLVAMFAVVILASTLIIPAIASTLQDLGGRMPGITIFMMFLSRMILSYWYLMIAGLGLVSFLFMLWKRSETGSLQFDTILLKLPMVSSFAKMQAVVQFSQVLGMLLDAGVNFSEALDIVSKVVNNKVLSKTLLEARSNIIKEGKIAKHLEKTNIFPPIACYMIKVGEESGQLAPMLLKVGNDYQEELFRNTDSLVAAINPIMTILMAIMIVGIVLSIFLPIMEMSNIGSLSGA